MSMPRPPQRAPKGVVQPQRVSLTYIHRTAFLYRCIVVAVQGPVVDERGAVQTTGAWQGIPAGTHCTCSFIAPIPALSRSPKRFLQGYPDPNTGWMNEEGVRIDMEHRLIPKPPLRSALKRPKAAGAGNQ